MYFFVAVLSYYQTMDYVPPAYNPTCGVVEVWASNGYYQLDFVYFVVDRRRIWPKNKIVQLYNFAFGIINSLIIENVVKMWKSIHGHQSKTEPEPTTVSLYCAWEQSSLYSVHCTLNEWPINDLSKWNANVWLGFCFCYECLLCVCFDSQWNWMNTRCVDERHWDRVHAERLMVDAIIVIAKG